ncbi:MAG: DUF2090 domain-containing protein [bacterium]|nr:DUF2090 domain-containing protein [bacterium]
MPMPALYVLPFDHRGSFQKMLFPGVAELSDEQHGIIKNYKRVIFEAIKVIGGKRGYADLAVLVDEQYGLDIHQETKQLGLRNMLTIEKSGQDIFDFQYEDWQQHLLDVHPSYAKALVRVVMGDDNSTQNSRLKLLNDFCADNGIGFLIEPLIQPSPGDLEAVDGSKDRFDAELRPKRFAEAVAEMYAVGVKPDVWKIEGTETKEAMDVCSEAAFNGGKQGVQIVILGRGATMPKVEHWLRAGAKSKGVNGFAVGRTVFSDSIEKLHRGEIAQERAIQEIAANYEHCIQVFEKARS